MSAMDVYYTRNKRKCLDGKNGGDVWCWSVSTGGKLVSISRIRCCVCRGVLRFWGSRIQDSRTDFWAKCRKTVHST
jgi:hypothetical protein